MVSSVPKLNIAYITNLYHHKRVLIISIVHAKIYRDHIFNIFIFCHSHKTEMLITDILGP